MSIVTAVVLGVASLPVLACMYTLCYLWNNGWQEENKNNV